MFSLVDFFKNVVCGAVELYCSMTLFLIPFISSLDSVPVYSGTSAGSDLSQEKDL